MAEGRPTNITEYYQDLERRVRLLERTATNYIPGYASDPVSPRDGTIWYNTSTNRLKIRLGGTTHYLTRDGTG